MSTACSSSSSSQTFTNSRQKSPKIDSLAPAAFTEKKLWQTSTTVSHVGPSTWQMPSSWSSPVVPKLTKPRNRSATEVQVTQDTAGRFASLLAADRDAALFPDVDSPFSDEVDVVNRLLPYHIFQQPQDDLRPRRRKGKGKVVSKDLETDIAETKFALECYRRRKALQDRFNKIQLRSGKHSAPPNQALLLAQAVLEADRADLALLSSELRNARADLDRIEREKRLSSMAARPTYYSSVQPQYFRGYPYTYAQPYGATLQSAPSPTPPVYSPPAAEKVAPAPSSGAIPVQLPVSSLPALHALGIVPVPASTLTPGHPQPPAVLRGSTGNGTVLSLEINVSLLQSAQMSGLAVVLNSLMSRAASGSNDVS